MSIVGVKGIHASQGMKQQPMQVQVRLQMLLVLWNMIKWYQRN